VPLPTYLGERTVLDTLDPAYARLVFPAGGLPIVVSRPLEPSGGVQWHPENFWRTGEFRALFEGFLEAANRRT